MEKPSLEKMRDEAKKIMKNAYNPYSKFFVGACILADDGNLYTGCNVENAAYGLTVCAEVSAICNMITNGAKRIISLAVIADSDNIVVPCGACRQAIREFADPQTEIHMFNNHNESNTMTLGELLPNAFGPEFLED
jgi:cytidine deaminase